MTFITRSLNRVATALLSLALISSGCAARPSSTEVRREWVEPNPALAAPKEKDDKYVREHYLKQEYQIPMRDGIRLFTAVYSPKDTSRTYPMMLFRTPYSVGPYGEDGYKEQLGPGWHFTREKFIFAYQDVRGRFMSEGEYENLRPHRPVKKDTTDIDESSDTYDTIEWLLKEIPNHNGRVGQWGISYPGFYTAAGMIDAHPALVAASPQAPVSDFFFDDFHHHGAFFLPHAFNFYATFGKPRPQPTTEWGKRFDPKTPDGYQFFMDLGPLGNADEQHFHGEIAFWNEITQHPNYDDFWKSKSILPHLKNVTAAVMTVGGWFDAEDLYGPLKIYQHTERNNPDAFNVLVMGPWAHGGWGRSDGDKLGVISFEAKTALFYREHIELPFFNHYLKGLPDPKLPEAYVFQTGTNRWRTFDRWPPHELTPRAIYLHENGVLSFDAPETRSNVASPLVGDEEPHGGFDEYISDPAKPVPFTQAIANGMTKEYMIEDQRFAARRPDVLAYQTSALEEDITFAGPIMAELWVSTSGTDSDWIVKLIDVFPPDTKDPEDLPKGIRLGGYQMMVRSEVIRGRFRNSYEHPEPFVPNEPTKVTLELLDVLHTFQKGHRIMVQIQSSWFPMVDRNPQKYVDNIFEAQQSDFIRATQRVYRSPPHHTRLIVGSLDQR
jgi:hypothetical protein